MGWDDYALARRYLTEMRIGTRIRQKKRDEDAQAKANREALRRQDRGR